MTAAQQQPYVGLALSGGGFRAAAFGLGCLRALHDTGVLRHVRVVSGISGISGISGGSLLAALWAYGPTRFDDFDDATTQMLRRGLQRDLALGAVSPVHLARRAAQTRLRPISRDDAPPRTNRTHVLAQLLADRHFGARTVEDVTNQRLATVLSATDLASGKAVRFGSQRAAAAATGASSNPSASPKRSPPAPRSPSSCQRSRSASPSSATAPAPPAPSRSPTAASSTTSDSASSSPGATPATQTTSTTADYVIACDAGRRETSASTARWFPRRLQRSFDITYRKTQDGSRGRLHSAGATGQIRGFVHAYLGMNDSRLPLPASGLVPAARVNKYPTNFAAMAADDIDALSARGQQLSRLLLQHYCPSLLDAI